MGIYRWTTQRLEAHFRTRTTQLVAAVALVKGDLCYMDSAGEMGKTDASAETTCDTLLGIAMEPIAASKSGTFALEGMFDTTGLTVGKLYVSTTAGAWSSTSPQSTGEIVRLIGYATKATEMYFHPDRTWIELG